MLFKEKRSQMVGMIRKYFRKEVVSKRGLKEE
jgi:hypothetical protein